MLNTLDWKDVGDGDYLVSLDGDLPWFEISIKGQVVTHASGVQSALSHIRGLWVITPKDTKEPAQEAVEEYHLLQANYKTISSAHVNAHVSPHTIIRLIKASSYAEATTKMIEEIFSRHDNTGGHVMGKSVEIENMTIDK